MQLETPPTTLSKSAVTVYELLSDVKNFEQLMPDSIETFEMIDGDTFKFALKGMPEIVLRLKEKYPHSKVVLGAASDKLPFTLTADITEIAAEQSEVTLRFEGAFNAMMGMMIKGPITNFMETLSQNMGNLG
ncbi:MAG: SRPBCC family protein [Bacteroidota bacterium]